MRVGIAASDERTTVRNEVGYDIDAGIVEAGGEDL
jgi:hypothetical protein